MPLRIQVERRVRVQLYIPRSVDRTAAARRFMLALAGGYTEHPNAVGNWCDAFGRPCEEPVRVFDALVHCAYGAALERVVSFGRAFMEDNPGEQCFMAYVGGRVLTIEREGETNAS